MYKNLKEYIDLLEKRGELVRITERVDPRLEISEIIDRMSKSEGGGKAMLFENTGTAFPLLAGMMGSERRMALALGKQSLNEISADIATLMSTVTSPKRGFLDKLKLLPTLGKASRWFPRHSSKRGECQQVVLQGEDVDLAKLPIPTTWPLDGGPFITLPLVHTTDPETGARNVGMYRMQVMSKNTTGMHWQMHKTGARHFEQLRLKNEELRAKGESPYTRMAVAVCLGGDPAYTYAATAPLPPGIEEYLLAGYLRGHAVKMVRCLTVDMEVPSDVDFVIEGYVDTAAELVTEGPFGDHTGFYSLEDRYPIFHVTCITHRRGAVYPATLVGVPPMEDRYIALATEKIFLEPIKLAVAPDITGLYMPWQGVAHNLAVVEITPSYAGKGLQVASALWGAGQMSFCKYIVVVDSIERFKREWGEKPWTIRGEVLLSSGIADVLDHAGEEMGRGGKMCIDTTSEKCVSMAIDVLFDAGVERLNDDEKLWIALGNSDPSRDVKIEESVIHLDARSKELAGRDFPNIVTMDNETIELVDRRWKEYSIGEFMASPSLRYKHLIIGKDAKQTKND